MRKGTAGEPRASACIDWLLRLYPPEYRLRFGHGMQAMLLEGLAAARTRGRMAALQFWFRSFRDAVWIALLERLRGRRVARAPAGWWKGLSAVAVAVPQEVRFTLRTLLKNSGFTATAVISVALGVGLSTAVFSVVHGVLLAPLPYPEPDRLTVIWKNFSENYPRAPLSPLEITALGREASLFDNIGGIWPVAGTLQTDAAPEPLRIGRVTWNFLEVLGTPPARGRWFTAQDEGRGVTGVILSHALWQQRFGGEEVLGRDIRIEGGWGFGGGDYTIVGIMPAGFEMLFPRSASVPRTVDLWVPFQGTWATASGSFLRVVGRLEPGATQNAGQEQIAGISSQSPFLNPIFGLSLHEDLVRDTRITLVTLQIAVLFVLLVACIGVASLTLVRAQGRLREMRIRTTLGAPLGTLVRLLLIETLLLAAAGGVLGLLLAQFGVQVFSVLAGGTLPRGGLSALSKPVLAFSILATLTAGLLCGLAPLLEIRRGRLAASLRARDRVDAVPAHARRAFVVAEIAFSVVLLIGAGLLTRSFLALRVVDPGFESGHVLTFRLPFSAERFAEGDDLGRFAFELEREVSAIHGVEAAGAINQLPLDGEPNYASSAWTRATAEDPEPPPLADYRMVTPGYFKTLGVELVGGRWFTFADDGTQPLVIIVDEGLAGRAWPGEDAVGQELRLASRDGPWAQVVGVVRHLRQHRLVEEAGDQIFIPFAQWPRNQLSVVVRGAGDPMDLIPVIRERIAAIDPTIAPSHIRPLDELAALSRAPARFSMVLASLFAGLSFVVACVSLYGVISYSVAQRTPELGVRAALGATRRDLLGTVVQQGVRLMSVGLVLGLGGAVVMVRWLTSLLFGVTAFDPATWLGVPLLVGAVTLLACYAPARRAGSIDAIVALRAD